MPDSLRAMIVLGLMFAGLFGMMLLATVVPPPLSLVGLLLLAGTFSYVGYRVEQPERERERRAKGLCVACGYDLTGNVSGVCPECGRPAAASV